MTGDDFMEIITTDLKERLDFWQMDIIADGMTTVAIIETTKCKTYSGNGKLSKLSRFGKVLGRALLGMVNWGLVYAELFWIHFIFLV